MTSPDAGQRCHRHADREAYISCQRCERPICPQCMNEASVGFQCPECVREGSKSVRAPRTMAGGAIQTRPGVVTTTLIAINVVLYVVQQVDDRITQQGAMLADSALTRSGVELVGVADGGYWRLITSAFLHNDLLHLGFNMVALFLFGPFVERALGTWRYLTAYLATAVVASVFVYVLTPANTLTVGASGAVFGLFAIALVLLMRARQDVTQLLILLAINAALSLRPGVSWQGHLGGFVAGFVIAVAIAYLPRDRRSSGLVGALVLMAVASAVAVVLRTAALA